MIAQHVFDSWLSDLRAREPRALEIAYSLALTLPQDKGTDSLRARVAPDEEGLKIISPDVRDLMQFAYDRYDALRDGNFALVDPGNPNILAFERACRDEQLLLVHNLARVSQPVKFRAYAGRAGWDILNRVEFIFPARAQLEAYEFLWLMLVQDEPI